MNFIVGSATTFKGKPPSFNVIYVDPATMLPVEYETYKFNLDEANAGADPEWSKYSDYKQLYNLTDLSPESFFGLSKQIYDDEEVAKQYRNHRYIDGPREDGGGLDAPCGFDTSCRLDMYC